MELVIQSLVVYGLIMFVMTNAGLYAYRRQYPNGYISNDCRTENKSSLIDLFTKSHFLIPILVICFFLAVRDRVGVDCESYKLNFYNILEGRTIRENMESGYTALVKFCTYFTDKHYFYFFIIALLQIVPLYYSMRKESHLLMFFGITFLLSTQFFAMMNGMRQYITACTFVAMTPLILDKKKWLWVIPILLLTITMHRSSLTIPLFALYGFLLRNTVLNRYMQLAIILICYLYMDRLENIISTDLFSFGAYSGYTEEGIEHYSEYSIKEKAFGLSSHLELFTYIVLVLYSNKLKTFYNSNKFNYIYNLFFLGICLHLLFYNNYVINRLLYFVNIFIPIVQAYLLFYLWYNKNKNNSLVLHTYIFILLTNILYYIYRAYNNIPEETLLYKFDL